MLHFLTIKLAINLKQQWSVFCVFFFFFSRIGFWVFMCILWQKKMILLFFFLFFFWSTNWLWLHLARSGKRVSGVIGGVIQLQQTCLDKWINHFRLTALLLEWKLRTEATTSSQVFIALQCILQSNYKVNNHISCIVSH